MNKLNNLQGIEMKRLLASTVIASGLLAFIPVSNAALILTGGSNLVPLSISGNDFNSDLQSLGYSHMTTGAQLSVDQAGSVTFAYIGAESGFTNTFNLFSAGSIAEANETFNFGGYGSSLTINVSAGDILNFNFTSNGGNNALSPVNNYAGTSLQGLGIFTKGNPQLGVFVSPLQVVLGYDDQFYINDDDDHDDMLIRVDFSHVPVPAAVWLFGSGLIGLIGFARRKASI